MKVRRLLVVLALAGAQCAVSATAFAQACVNRPDLMLCGASERPLSGLYSGIGPFNEVSGCAPGANTQAMFVSRNAAIAGNGPAWLAYLNAGGRIITEYSTGAAIYNEIYGTAYANGGQAGACYDNPMPSAKLNTGHPFWVANPIPATPAAIEGCGLSLAGLVAGEPTVTPLGARSADTTHVNFAIKPPGWRHAVPARSRLAGHPYADLRREQPRVPERAHQRLRRRGSAAARRRAGSGRRSAHAGRTRRDGRTPGRSARPVAPLPPGKELNRRPGPRIPAAALAPPRAFLARCACGSGAAGAAYRPSTRTSMGNRDKQRKEPKKPKQPKKP